jgi:FkbM family methyltransferase
MPLIIIPIKEIECVTGKTITGIIHVGASVGEENEEYRTNGIKNVVWIEPLKESFEKLKLLGIQPGNKVFNYAISDINGQGKLLVTNNHVSSSLRDLGMHKYMSPDVVIQEEQSVILKRLDTLIEENKLDIQKHNMLVVDTQGTEDLVIDGCGKYLEQFDILFLELNINEVYKGCIINTEMEARLAQRGFHCVIQKLANSLQTEAIFVRTPINPYFVIQGHTTYCDEIIHSYRNVKNVVWCTDADAPVEHLDKIQNSNIHLVTIPALPSVFGKINRQIQSSLTGIQKAKELGADCVIKIRSDLVISNYEKFLNNLQADGKIYSILYTKHNDVVKPDSLMINNTSHWLNINYPGKIEDTCNFNYLTDWMFYGPIEKMLLMYEKANLSDIAVDNIMCEMRVIASYLINRGLKINLNLEYLKQEFGIIMGQMEKLGIDIYSLKMQMNYSKMHIASSIGAIPGVYIPD